MAQSLDEAAALTYAPTDLKPFIKSLTKGKGKYNFQSFLAADNWKKTKGSMWTINVMLSDIDGIAKKLGETKTTVGNKKVVDYVTASGYKIRFKESLKTGAGKTPDAKTTRKQELGSAYIFGYALKYRRSGWKTFSEFENDQRMIKGLVKLYPEAPDSDWLGVYFKQHKVILDKFSKSDINRFDHSGSNSFMKYISDVVKDNFGVRKKDNWNPADIWGVKGSNAKVKKQIEETVFGSKDSQTIEQLNAVLRGMYKADVLVGISLKKTSPGQPAKWEEYNIEKLTMEEIDEYKYKDIKLICNLGEDMTSDSKVQLRGSGGAGEVDFQIRQNSKGFSNLKWESTMTGARGARGGKAQVDFVVKLVDDNGQKFEKSNGKYPKTAKEFTKETVNGNDLSDWKKMYENISGSGVETMCAGPEKFASNMEAKFVDDAEVANSKLMQLSFINDVVNIREKKKKKKYTEFWTDMVFLSIKKGDRFGPFGKLY